jgi:hypothetical protein
MKPLETAENKLLDQLDIWCITFMIMGTQSETPRYSQIMPLDSFSSSYDDDFKLILKSTVAVIRYDVNFTDEENKALIEMYRESKLWDWWKSIRTQYLVDNYPTIKHY